MSDLHPAVLILGGLVWFALLIYTGTRGSLASIRKEWHDEVIYSRCIRPYVQGVMALGLLATIVAMGLVAFVVARILFPSEESPNPLFRNALFLGPLGIVGLVADYLGTYLAGRWIYGANIRKAGYR